MWYPIYYQKDLHIDTGPRVIGARSGAMSERPLVILALAVVAVIVIGEAVVYTSDYTDYSADATYADGEITYTVGADGSKVYDVVVLDNGTFRDTDRIIIYYDPTYASDYEDVNVSIGARPLDQEAYVSQLVASLEFRGVHDVLIVDAGQLREELSEGIGSGATITDGLVVLSGSLPDTVYTGNGDDLILTWIDRGGCLYWAGNLLGSSYSTTDGTVPVEGYQELFFGSECLNTDPDLARAYSETGELTHDLALKSNSVRYAVDPDLLPEGTECFSTGFTEGGFDSMTFVGKGDGMICVIGGDFSDDQRNDLAQAIACGLCPQSDVVAAEHGSVSGSTSGTVAASGENLSAYIFLGGYYPVFGKLVRL